MNCPEIIIPAAVIVIAALGIRAEKANASSGTLFVLGLLAALGLIFAFFNIPAR